MLNSTSFPDSCIVGNLTVCFSQTAKNLGVMFDDDKKNKNSGHFYSAVSN